MPLTDQTLVNSYTGNGVTTSFTYGFKIFAQTDLRVTVDGVLKTLTTDYTVTGVGADGGGSVVFGTAPASLAVVTVYSESAYSRITTDYQENGDLLAATLDDDMDKLTRLTQQLRRDVKRAVKLPIEETDDKGVLTVPASRVNKVLAFDSAGAPTVKTATEMLATMTTVGNGLALASGDLKVAPGTVGQLLKTNASSAVEWSGGPFVTAVGTAAEHAAPLSQIQGGAYAYAVDSGAADALVATLSPAITAYTIGMTVQIKTVAANATTTPTLNINGLGAKTINRNSGALLAGDIKANGYSLFQYYETGGTGYFMLLNPILTGTADLAALAVTTAKLAAGAVDSTKASGVLGTWDATKAVDTSYLAATDLIIHVWCAFAAGNTGVSALTDAANPPTTQVNRMVMNNAYTVSACLTFVCKKGHYYKVLQVGTPTSTTINVMPIGA